MAYWLLKTEPVEFSAADLKRDGRTTWDGVANALALKHLRTMNKGDLAALYHTGDERRCVAIAEVVSAANANAIVELKFKAMLARPVTLAEIKADAAFAGWDLLRIGRLSVVPTPAKMWNRLLELSSADVET